eukprot:356225-Chlamydomonas_euryale.AAC.8
MPASASDCRRLLARKRPSAHAVAASAKPSPSLATDAPAVAWRVGLFRWHATLVAFGLYCHFTVPPPGGALPLRGWGGSVAVGPTDRRTECTKPSPARPRRIVEGVVPTPPAGPPQPEQSPLESCSVDGGRPAPCAAATPGDGFALAVVEGGARGGHDAAARHAAGRRRARHRAAAAIGAAVGCRRAAGLAAGRSAAAPRRVRPAVGAGSVVRPRAGRVQERGTAATGGPPGRAGPASSHRLRAARPQGRWMEGKILSMLRTGAT